MVLVCVKPFKGLRIISFGKNNGLIKVNLIIR